jgi:pantothenate synthetase
MTFSAFENGPGEGNGNLEACFSQYPRNLANDRKPHHQPVFIVFKPEKTDKT